MPAVPIQGSRFLVTGGSGFVGSHVVDELVGAGADEVVVFDKVVRGENLEHAPKAGSVRSSRATSPTGKRSPRPPPASTASSTWPCSRSGRAKPNPRLALDVNVVGTFNVLEAAQRGRGEEGRLLLGLVRLRRHERDHGRVAPARGPHDVRRLQDRGRVLPARLQRDLGPRLRHAPLHERLRAPPGGRADPERPATDRVAASRR